MSKSKNPYMPFFPSDWMGGTSLMTYEEKGMYIDLICVCWQTQTIPKKRLGLIINKSWEEMSNELKDKFIDQGDSIVNKRVYKDLVLREEFIEKQRINGQKGGRPKTQKKLSTSTSITITNTNTNSNSISRSIYIPTKNEFLDYGLEIIRGLNKNPKEYHFQLESKYDTWIDDDWKDGHNKKIKNWKNKLKNTIQYLKPIYENTTRKKTQEYSDSFKGDIIKKLNS